MVVIVYGSQGFPYYLWRLNITIYYEIIIAKVISIYHTNNGNVLKQ